MPNIPEIKIGNTVYQLTDKELRENIKSALTINDLMAEEGSIRVIDGVDFPIDGYIKTGFLKFSTYPFTINAAEGYEFLYRIYYKDFTYRTGISAFKTTYTFSSDTGYVRFIIRKTSGSITPADIASAFSTDMSGVSSVAPQSYVMRRMSEQDERVTEVEDTCSQIGGQVENIEDAIGKLDYIVPVVYRSGGLNGSGTENDDPTRITTNGTEMPMLSVGDYIDIGGPFEGRIAACSDRPFYQHNIGWITGSGWVSGKTTIPETWEGVSLDRKYFCVILRDKSDPTADISSLLDTVGESVIVCRKNGAIVALDERVTEVEDTCSQIESTYELTKRFAETIPYKLNDNGGKMIDATTGEAVADANSFRCTDNIDVSAYDYLVYARYKDLNSSSRGLAFYTAEEIFIDGETEITAAAVIGYETRIIKIPDNAKYVRLTARVSIDGFFIKGLRSNPLKGLKLSILSDSMSAFKNYIPEGNAYYYSGTNAGVSNPNEMWWKILCNNTGMMPWVIDAWSGSSIAYNYATDSSHQDTKRIPMCSDLRTQRLGKTVDGVDVPPDVIIISGGTNDWTYAKQTTTPLGDWDGRTAIDRSAVIGGTATFAESYASLITELQTNYPNAIIVGASLYYTNRGTPVGTYGATRVNDMGNTCGTYNAVIEKVCKLMGVPFVDIYNVGFNYNNYYPTYAIDDAETPTHMNARGQAVLAKRWIEALPNIIQQIR